MFHYFCHIVAATCCLLFLTKCILAWKTVADELSNPATATPVGVVCITLICVAAGRGTVGEVIVICTSIFHVLLSFWFLYIAIFKFRLWPDPGWFPNTVGIAYASIKTWLYFPVPGLAIMVVRSCNESSVALVTSLFAHVLLVAMYGLPFLYIPYCVSVVAHHRGVAYTFRLSDSKLLSRMSSVGAVFTVLSTITRYQLLSVS